jgi:UPF0271 protein
MRHVKPHGMLYNQAAGSALADAIARAVRDCDPQLIWSAWRAVSLFAPGNVWGLPRVRKCLPIADISRTARWFHAAAGRLITDDEGAGANAGDGLIRNVKSINGRRQTLQAKRCAYTAMASMRCVCASPACGIRTGYCCPEF